MPVEGNLVYGRILDLVPKVLSTIQELLDGKKADELDELAKTAETQAQV